MADLNKVMLIGRIGDQPKLAIDEAGTRCGFVVNTGTHVQKNGVWTKETVAHYVTAHGPLADKCAEFLTAGQTVYVEGRLTANGITATDVHFLKADSTPAKEAPVG